MSAAIPVVDMCSGTGRLFTAVQAVIRTAPPHRDDLGRLRPAFAEWMMGLPRRKRSHGQRGSAPAGSAVVARQAALMLTRRLGQLDATYRKELS